MQFTNLQYLSLVCNQNILKLLSTPLSTLLSSGQSSGQFTVHTNVDSPVDSPVDGFVVQALLYGVHDTDAALFTPLRPAAAPGSEIRRVGGGSLRPRMSWLLLLCTRSAVSLSRDLALM